MNSLVLLVLVAVCIVSGSATLTSVIQTDKGPVQGKVLTTVLKTKEYASFLGIPYAKPPTGSLRFKPPVVNDAWTDVLNATVVGNMCTQFDSASRSVVGSEDCLYLNVFTPHTKFSKSTSKPVMIWIYGGSFTTGNSNPSFYGPDFILEEDVIVVSFNYRLSALGFLNLNHDDAFGNSGLKDQNLALKWVKRNIAKFGGNPKKVTIFGQSAGAASVDLHTLSDMSRELFQHSISMSGSPLSFYWGFQTSKEAEERAFTLGSKLGINTLSKDVLLKNLLNASAVDIIAAATQLAYLPFRPTIESTNVAKGQEKFLTTCTVKKYLTGAYEKVPHMMGFTSNETVFFAGSLAKLTEEALSSIKDVPAYNNLPFMQYLKTFTNKNLTVTELFEFIKLTTDLFYVIGIDAKQQLMNLNNLFPIYSYRFSFNPSHSLHKTLGIPLEGVGHGDDVPYLLYMPIAKLPLNQSDIAKTRNRVVRLYTNFAKYGDPTPNGANDKLLGLTWSESGVSGVHLEINTDLTMESRPVDSTVQSLQLVGLGASLLKNECSNDLCSN